MSEAAQSAGVERLAEAFDAADLVLVGAGAGLSTSAGLAYSGERFERWFADFARAYSFRDMYSGGFFPYATLEEHWAYWSRYIWCNRYGAPPRDTYGVLRELLVGKDHFVLTTNVDHQFQRAGFDKRRLFYTQGDYGLWQCSRPCHAETYDNEETVRAMMAAQGFALGKTETGGGEGAFLPPCDADAWEHITRRVPTELVPRCPRCGAPMSMNLRADDTFVEDAGWHAAAARYHAFVERCRGARVLFLELGVGGNTPVIVKYPFWRMTSENAQATYACVNKGEAFAPSIIADRSVCLDADIDEVLRGLARA
ncbi:MAG: Sir2 silent information regulator family NAD-dependent deacetylase [Eggerthellaceae bacterium]|nr:Sir2 silent information regulator family NAD-dependent deacetylase [Eggerthellaceae bacterium]